VKYQELVLEKYIDAQELPPYDDPILEELEIKLGNIVSGFNFFVVTIKFI
jgi:hypothetical protein